MVFHIKNFLPPGKKFFFGQDGASMQYQAFCSTTSTIKHIQTVCR